MSGSILPRALLDSLEGQAGFDRAAFEAVHRESRAPVSVRFNRTKLLPSEGIWPAPVAEPSFALDRRVPWSEAGWYLAERPSFTFDPFFHAGAYYVQEASGMFVEEALRQLGLTRRPLRALDLCAAPGGKSTVLQSTLHEESLLVSNEIIKPRNAVLRQNLARWGAATGVVTGNEARDFASLGGLFDVMLVDAPCSGSGLFRREPEAVREWSPGSVAGCCVRQKRILQDAWPALAEGGYLLYTTCSFSPEENEDIAAFLLATGEAESVSLRLDSDWGIVASDFAGGRGTGYRFYPDRLAGEGFFLAAFRKISTAAAPVPAEGKPRPAPGVKEFQKAIAAYIKNVDEFVFFNDEEGFTGISTHFAALAETLRGRLYVRKTGVRIGSMAGTTLIPDHELALAADLAPEVPAVPVDRDAAIDYLRKRDRTFGPEARGWTLVRHQGQALGWIKALGNRVNNYYPKSWRILK